MDLALEQSARDEIKQRVRASKWSLSDCVEHLAAVGYSTNIGSVHRFLKEPNRRLGLDEFGAWALALSVPPMALLAPARGRKTRRALMVRDWFRGTAPLPEVPDPSSYVQAARLDRPADEPELAVELRRQADRYLTARPNERAHIEAELSLFLANKQLAAFASGQAVARRRHGSTVGGTEQAEQPPDGTANHTKGGEQE